MERKVDPASVETALVTRGLDTPSESLTQHPSSYVNTEEGRFVPGTLLGGRYRIIGLLGVGGMGEVYRATDLTLGQSVALKFLPAEAATNQRLLERFHGEVRVARQVSHPNVCRVYDIGQIEGMPFISMEYVDGEDLASLLRRIGRLPGDKAVETARKICAGLAAAHDKGVIHRDLKPHNIMMNKRGEVLIMDFGLAAIADQLGGSEVRNGTPLYMAPEQLRGSGVSARSDIYSLGLVLYEIFTGRRPYEASSIQHLLEQQEAAQLTSMSSIAADVEPAVEQAIRRCLDPDPARRPPSALAVAAALPGGDPLAAALAAGETPSPEMVAQAGHTEGLSRRYSIPCLLLILACLFASTIARDKTYAMLRTPLDLSPEVLAQKARELASSFGYTRKPGDSEIVRLDQRPFLINYLNRQPEPRKWNDWLASEAPVSLVYRESLGTLEGRPMFGAGRVTQENPAPIIPGMVQVQLEGRGKLREFYGLPYNREATTPDPAAIFQATGFDRTTFKQVDPNFIPRYASDTVQFWQGSHPVLPNMPISIEMAWWKGMVTHVRVNYPYRTPEEDPLRLQRSWIRKLQGNMYFFASLIGTVFVLLLARRNWKFGRTDRKGAMRIAAAKFLLGMIVWFGTVHPVQSETMLFALLDGASEWVLASLMIFVLYLALEPAVRAHWPHSLVTWNRVLVGRWLDPQVGAHILIGAAIGCAVATLAAFLQVWKLGGEELISGGGLAMTLGVRQWLADQSSTVLGSLNSALVGFFCIFGLRMILRKDILAAIAGAVLFAFVQRQILFSADWRFQAAIFVFIFAVLIFVVLRLGFVAVMSAGVFIDNFEIALGLDWKGWYAPYGIATLVLLMAIALFAFYRSLGSRDLLGSSDTRY